MHVKISIIFNDAFMHRLAFDHKNTCRHRRRQENLQYKIIIIKWQYQLGNPLMSCNSYLFWLFVCSFAFSTTSYGMPKWLNSFYWNRRRCKQSSLLSNRFAVFLLARVLLACFASFFFVDVRNICRTKFWSVVFFFSPFIWFDICNLVSD